MSTTVAPGMPPLPQGTWRAIADEGQSVEVPANSTVRYGQSPALRFVQRVVSGSVSATNGFFGGDPAPNVRKGLWLMVAEEAAPPPAEGGVPSPQPAPEPSPAPQPPAETPAPQPPAVVLPGLSDPDFDRKMRLLEFAQRERALDASARSASATEQLAAQNKALAEASRYVAEKYAALQAMLEANAGLPPIPAPTPGA